jgi:hypothetical protein
MQLRGMRWVELRGCRQNLLLRHPRGLALSADRRLLSLSDPRDVYHQLPGMTQVPPLQLGADAGHCAS